MKVTDLTNAVEESVSVPIHKFVLLSDKLDENFYAFFEGNDAPYYVTRISHTTALETQSIICGNKKNVIAVFDHISTRREYDKYFKGFFVDRDFDDTLIGSKVGIYETPCYSIENLYCCKTTLTEILKSEFKLSLLDNEFNEIHSLFDKNFEKYNSSVLTFNAWYLSVKFLEHSKGIHSNVNLNDKLPSDFIEIKDMYRADISQLYDLEKIETLFPSAPKISLDLLNVSIQKLDCDKKLRGKYQLQFFLKFLDFIIEDANKIKAIIKRKTKFQFGKGQALSHLSVFAKTPQCLTEYIKTCCGK